MTIPRLNGWWDEIGSGLTNLTRQLPSIIQPDNVANKKLEEMVRQNPMLMEQFSNMDDATRSALATSLGFKKQNPLANLPVGAERMAREEQRSALQTLTPEQKIERQAKVAGVTPTADLLRKRKVESQQDIQFETQQKLAGLNTQILTSQIGELKDAEKQIQDARAKYPDLDKVDIFKAVRNMLYKGDAPDASLLTAVQANKGAALIFDSAMKLELQKMQDNARIRLQSMKDPNEATIFIRGLSEYGRQLNNEEARIQGELKLAQEEAWRDPKQKARASELTKQLVQVRNKSFENSMLTAELNKKLAGDAGVVIPETLSGRVTTALERIKSGKATIADVDASPVFTPEEKAQIKANLGKK